MNEIPLLRAGSRPRNRPEGPPGAANREIIGNDMRIGMADQDLDGSDFQG